MTPHDTAVEPAGASVAEVFARFPERRSLAEHYRLIAIAIYEGFKAHTGMTGTFDELPAEQRGWLIDDAARAIAGRIGVLDHEARTRTAELVLDDPKFLDLDPFTLETARIAASEALVLFPRVLLRQWHERTAK